VTGASAAGASAPLPIHFSMNELPLLETGMTTTPLGHATNLWVHGKVYSRGGENALHAHQVEDHVFFVLQGAARFEFGDGTVREVRPLEGFVLPKGVLYRFEALGDGNLVMLRVGAAQIGSEWSGARRHGAPEEVRLATGIDGSPLKSRSKEKGRTPAEPVSVIEGRFVADNWPRPV
jgi:mannose-6-phosphate isomerase-like protein (cupin superfamily)